MKSAYPEVGTGGVSVAPFVGAWIEISPSIVIVITDDVAPFVGAWIEIIEKNKALADMVVAPFVGAWIEIEG